MTITLGELAELTHGELHGDPDLTIRAAKPVTEAGPGDITFIDNEKYLSQLADSRAAAVVPLGLMTACANVIHVADPLASFIAIVRHVHGHAAVVDEVPGISPRACVDPTATVGADARIAAFASVGAFSVIGPRCRLSPGVVVGRGCQLGDDVTLHPNVVLYDGTVLGNRVTVHANSVLGADGFGYRFQNGRHVKVPQLGRVEVADDVEVGACTTIDRGTFSATRVGEGTKIDNLVMIAHNCQVGRHNVIVSQAGLAGSSGTGDHVVIAGQVGVVEHVHIGDRSVIGGQAAVTKDVPPDARMLGSPATPEQDQKRILMSLLRLPEFRRELRALQERLGLAG